MPPNRFSGQPRESPPRAAKRLRSLPTFEACLHEIEAAEEGCGWLSACEEAGRFLLLSRELIAALSGLLRSLTPGRILEVCAGRGELAEALAATGVHIVATDSHVSGSSARRQRTVVRLSASEALRRYRPAVVLGAFVPFDSGVDAAVMACDSVLHYVVLGARVGGLLGSAMLWQNPNWGAEPMPEISRWMLTRHDVWLGGAERKILQHGEAWVFRRAQ
ncbi:MAG: hypothetical protein N3D11_01110 [Candidatus Sumerlaeia bacterium]|nr:hypothetical protein [Candidatus Sumerlaeia bacterium]